MLYMLFFASCIYSLKKSQLETKRGGNKRQNPQTIVHRAYSIIFDSNIPGEHQVLLEP